MPGERIGEAIAEIETGWMPALAEIVEGLPCEMGLADSERLDYDAGPAEKHIALADGFRRDLAFENNGKLQEVRGADQASVRVMNDLRVLDGLGFVEENCGEGRSVDDHFGRPCSS